ncbi:DUF521 domain-containing protein (plasmid) [Vibrio europaeus]|uniref:DUF521 domain-containing protein n=1 Tax=Vibrio europaeus TaxID=300876 RepID=A0AAE7DYX6_9VIBR|nr:aconitase X [Vibrio europaeus]QJY38020.1 DUF521 domain-containing protein [Vibrio europaeus]
MQLTDTEQAFLMGEAGRGMQKCMQMLVNFSNAFGASRLVKIASAHVIPNIPLGLLEAYTQEVESVSVMTTLHPHMSALCPSNWQSMGIGADYAYDQLADVKRRAALFAEKGFNQTYTCYPPSVGSLAKKGDFVSWIGSGGQVLVNSTIGARCNRDGALLTLACAITGRAPYHGLFLDENRLAQVHVRFSGVDANSLTKSELSAVGYYLGAQAQTHNIVVEGIERGISMDSLRQLMIPLTVTGAVGVCHVPGSTPEADNVNEALGAQRPIKHIVVDRKVVTQSLATYAPKKRTTEVMPIVLTPKDGAITRALPGSVTDMVVLGCPHLSIQEVRLIAQRLSGKVIPSNRHLWIGLAHQQYQLAKEMGYANTIESAGGLMVSACMSTIPDSPIPKSVSTLMTSSMKAAHYITQLNRGRISVAVADIEQCIDALLH